MSPARCVLLLTAALLCWSAWLPCTRAFSVSDFDSYGPKIAGNEWVAAEIINQDNSQGYVNFFTNYSNPPLSTSLPQSYCAAYLDETWYAYQGDWSMFAYGVAVGSRDSTTQSIVWWGENDGGNWNDNRVNLTQMTVAAFSGMTVVPTFSCYPNNGTTDPNGIPATISVSTSHEEFFQLAVKPEGEYAVAIANSFGFTMGLLDLNPTAHSLFTYQWTQPSRSPLYQTPLDQTFGPRAVALETTWGVTAGWVQNDATKQWSAVAFLFNHTATTITLADRWLYAPATGTWQASVQVGDASTWKPQHDIALAVRQDGAVLLGLQLYNTVFLFAVQGGRLLLQGSKSQTARQVGFGKTVSWTNTDAAQVLYNQYSSDYSTVLAASAVQLYDIPSASTLNSSDWTDSYPSPSYLYPNPTQQLATTLTSGTFTTAISTPSTLYILDPVGSILFIQPAGPGSYQPTVSGYDRQQPCPPGTFSDVTSYEACQLCPPNTYRQAAPGNECLPCPADAFCPLGSVYPIDVGVLGSEAQTFVYPASPESTILDDILIQNVFALQSGGHCVSVSPVFWGLIVLAVLILVLVCMFRLRYCVNDAKSRKIRRLTKFVFKRTDLVKEGEHWIGGLMSLVLMVFVIFGIWFVSTFLAQYPYETAPNPNFACQPTWNAKFSSSMMSVALPPDDIVGPMYDMLGEQELTLGVDVVNTNISCLDVAAFTVTSVVTPISFACTEGVGLISVQVALPEHTTTVRFVLTGPQLIGGLRLVMLGDATSTTDPSTSNLYQLRQITAAQSLYILGSTLQKSVNLPISLTRVINSTDPLASGGSVFVSGLWIPVFPAATDAMFIGAEEYLATAAGAFELDVPVSESGYWVLNEQSPIARSAEAAFKTLLYIIMLLEVFGLAFLLFKLIQPLVHCLALKGKGRSVKKVWDRPDSSDEEDWLEELLYGDRVRPMGSARRGVRELTESERTERHRARQERREAREGKTPREEGESGRRDGHAVEGDRAYEVQLTAPNGDAATHITPGQPEGTERVEATEV